MAWANREAAKAAAPVPLHGGKRRRPVRPKLARWSGSEASPALLAQPPLARVVLLDQPLGAKLGEEDGRHALVVDRRILHGDPNLVGEHAQRVTGEQSG